MTEATWDRIMAVNLKGVMFACKHALPIMRAQGSGVITNISSAAAVASVGLVAYKASKAALNAYSQSLANGNAKYGIRANVIAPGLMGTPAMMAMPEDFRQGLERLVQYPKRLGQPEVFALLATQIVENPYLNGETIRLDGAIRM